MYCRPEEGEQTWLGPKLLDEVREVMRRLHCPIHTERSYCDRIAEYVLIHGMRWRERLLAAERGWAEIERCRAPRAVATRPRRRAESQGPP